VDVPPRPIDLEALLRAHAFLRVERPPELWTVDILDEPCIRMLGEMIVVGLLHHDVLAELTLNVSNVRVDEEAPEGVERGDYISISILGPGRWEHDRAWTPSAGEPLWSPDLDAALRAASVSYAYLRSLGEAGGAITAWVPRAHRGGSS
jgi:hypothetical protein